VKGNPVIEAGAQLVHSERVKDTFQRAFERENALRNKIVKVMAKATGISEKHFVNDTAEALESRITKWVSFLKNKVRKGYPLLEERLAELEDLVQSKDAQVEDWRKRAARIGGLVQELCNGVEAKVEEIRDIEHDIQREESVQPSTGLVKKAISPLETQLMAIRSPNGGDGP
jgi:predicted  nucleic acid-binding Zn-ribbon protein